MRFEEVQRRVEIALGTFIEVDSYVLEHDLREECIAARVAFHLQAQFPEFSVDVEYNRFGDLAKRLMLPHECAKKLDRDGRVLVLPDIIVHQRGPDGPNLLVVEIKKTSNPIGFGCDRLRLHAFREQLDYCFGALLECDTRAGHGSLVRVIEWIA